MAHNGHTSHFSERRERWASMLDQDIKEHVQGNTDSELIGALTAQFFRNDGGRDVRALERAVQKLTRLLDTEDRAYAEASDAPSNSSHFSSCNVGVFIREGNTISMVATRFRTGDGDPPSLYVTSGSAWRRSTSDPRFTDFSMVAGIPISDFVAQEYVGLGAVVVSSEPLSKGPQFKDQDYFLLAKDQMVSFEVNLEEKLDGTLRFSCLSHYCREDLEFRRKETLEGASDDDDGSISMAMQRRAIALLDEFRYSLIGAASILLVLSWTIVMCGINDCASNCKPPTEGIKED